MTSYYTSTRQEIEPFVPNAARTLLDVGCGEGYFGELLKRSRPQMETWGVEIIPAVADSARARLDRVVCAPFSTAAALPRAYFDVVTFNDSLEHFPDPMPPLALTRELLNPDGVVVLSVPNVRHIENLKSLLLDRDWKYAESGILDRTHLRFFTRVSLVRTLEEAGYEVLRIEGINRRWLGWKLALLCRIARPWIEDTLYLQFAVVARPVR